MSGSEENFAVWKLRSSLPCPVDHVLEASATGEALSLNRALGPSAWLCQEYREIFIVILLDLHRFNPYR